MQLCKEQETELGFIDQYEVNRKYSVVFMRVSYKL